MANYDKAPKIKGNPIINTNKEDPATLALSGETMKVEPESKPKPKRKVISKKPRKPQKGVTLRHPPEKVALAQKVRGQDFSSYVNGLIGKDLIELHISILD